ncbi:hypothetical protein WDW86_07160 [Bdellovibrionota bacterium FG-2]
MSKRGIFVGVLFLLGGALGEPNCFAFTLDLPCAPDKPTTQAPNPLPPCASFKARLAATLENYVKAYADSYYSGTTELLDKDSKTPPPQDFGTPVCNLLPSPLNKCTAEPDSSNKNVRGNSCGDLIYLGVTIDVVLKWCTKFKVPFPCDIGSNNSMLLDGSGTKGTTEYAWVRGGWIHILAFKWKEVESEILSTQKITVASSCEPAAKKLAALFSDMKELTSSITAEFGPDVPLNSILTGCVDSASWIWNPDVTAPQPDLGKMRQRLQYVCAAQAAIDKGIGTAALCEVMDRAGKTFQSEFFDSPSGGSFIADSIKPISDACASECRSKCDPSCWHDSYYYAAKHNVSNECSSCATTCANTCYNTRLRERVTNKLKPFSVKASAGGCSNGPQ